jgi:hypothetical protein
MTDIRARLADALHEKFLWMLRETANEIVDYLLSLPGIAIVELPEGNPWDLSVIRVHCLGAELPATSPAMARAVAANLLAAAAAVQAQELP